MQMIYKYVVSPLPFINATVKIPASDIVLHVGVQENNFCLWVLEDVDATPMREVKREIKYKMYVTGQSVEDIENLNYVTTVQSGKYVGHIFERS